MYIFEKFYCNLCHFAPRIRFCSFLKNVQGVYWDEQFTKRILTIQILWTLTLNRKTTIQRHWNKFIRLKSPERNWTMFRCNRFQIKLEIHKPSIVNFKIRNSQKFQSIVSFFPWEGVVIASSVHHSSNFSCNLAQS